MLEKKQIGSKSGMIFTPTNDGKKRIYRKNRLLSGEITPGQASPEEVEEANRIIRENPTAPIKKPEDNVDQTEIKDKLSLILDKLNSQDTKEVHIHHTPGDVTEEKSPEEKFIEVDSNKLQADIYNKTNVDTEVTTGYDELGSTQKKKSSNRSLVEELRRNLNKKLNKKEYK